MIVVKTTKLESTTTVPYLPHCMFCNFSIHCEIYVIQFLPEFLPRKRKDFDLDFYHPIFNSIWSSHVLHVARWINFLIHCETVAMRSFKLRNFVQNFLEEERFRPHEEIYHFIFKSVSGQGQRLARFFFAVFAHCCHLWPLTRGPVIRHVSKNGWHRSFFNWPTLARSNQPLTN